MSGSADVDDIAVFVDRLTAAGSDQPTALAAAQIRRRINEGATPPGIRRLAEALAASATEPPAQRRPADEPGSIVAAMDVCNLIVLADHVPDEIAAALAALLADGRRVVVTGPAAADLDVVRSALPPTVTDLVVTRFPAVSPTELRELRRLLLTDTRARRARAHQQLPPQSAVPAVDVVTDLCRTVRSVPTETDGGLLGDVEPQRLTAVAPVARAVRRALGALGPRHHRPWTLDLVSELVLQRHRVTFDRLREELAQARAAAAAIDGASPVTFVEPLTDEGLAALADYHGYLEAGGWPRAFFLPIAQRRAQPVLSQIRVAGQVPVAAADVALALHHHRLTERIDRIRRYCTELGIPPLRDAGGLDALAEKVDKVTVATRAMTSLRRDVLFLRDDSPIPPPDVSTAAQVAAEIIAIADRAPSVEAERTLDEMADELAELVPGPVTAPEHERAVAALRARDAVAYDAAVDALGAARREARDSERQATLLTELRETAPTMAAAWTAPGGPVGLGMACFLPAGKLLSALPPADSADVVVVLGATRLGVERLLLAAVAPRLVAVAGPGEKSDDAPNLLSVLRRASALVIRGRSGSGSGRVVQLARTVVSAQRTAQVG